MELNQVTVGSTDVVRSKRFYELLGFRLVVDTDHYLRFVVGNSENTFSVELTEKVVPGSSTLYLECDNVSKAYMQLKSLGIEFQHEPVKQNWLWVEARFTDPDGNVWCLYNAGENRLYPPWSLLEK